MIDRFTRGMLLSACVPLAVLLAPGQAVGQVEDEVVREIWLDYNPSYTLSPKADIYGDIAVRTQTDSGGWWRFIVRPNLRYSVSEIVLVAGGVGSFYTWNEEIADRWELRPWQGVTVVWPRLPFELQHVLRLEERFEFDTETWSSQSSLRLRYRLRASKRWAKPETYWRLLGSLELFGTLAGTEGQSAEQLRLTTGLERGSPSPVRVRLELTWQKAGRFIGDGSFNELFFRLRIFHRWGG
jgi:hypothetical protein